MLQDLPDTGLVNGKAELSPKSLADLEEGLRGTRAARRYGNQEIHSRPPESQKLGGGPDQWDYCAAIMPILELIEELAQLCPLGFKLRVAVFVVAQEFAGNRVYIQGKSVVPAARDSPRVQIQSGLLVRGRALDPSIDV